MAHTAHSRDSNDRGVIITVPWAAHGATSTPDIDGETWAWFLVAGPGNGVGLLLMYSGYRVGKVTPHPGRPEA